MAPSKFTSNIIIRFDSDNAIQAKALAALFVSKGLTTLVEDSTIENGQNKTAKAAIQIDLRGQSFELDLADHAHLKPFRLDLSRRYPARGKDPLLRAIGQSTGHLLDLTGGWCQDALHVARSGMKVTAIERNPVIYSVVNHALKTGQKALENQSDPTDLIDLYYGDSVDLMNQLSAEYDVVYLDPMYPTRKNTAASPKEITILKSILEITESNSSQQLEDLFDFAMKKAVKRVVVKRPHFAPPLHICRVGEIAAKQVRFDIYQPSNGAN